MGQSARDKMAELRIVCERDVEIQRQKVDAAVNSFRKYLQFMKTRSKQTVDYQVKLGKLKAQFREVEDGLVKALAGGEIGCHIKLDG
ncbi:hypothetical protein Nepgr_003102 [Nepenthes gracilis]|uniref:Uncharacterized protein n=1 Tax=Nepenthes gracilis TaxID=150966 RepID=A0AAD3RYX0_NEPGR|nr:hypothetical protein Nepgr_003102 [Nepenthes gracilis]